MFSYLLKLLKAIFIFLVVFFYTQNALADFVYNSETSRESIAHSARTKKFYDVKKAISRLAIGGSYDFDQNSKQYQLVSRYFYQSNRFIHEVNFIRESEYADRGSGAKKQFKIKTSDVYDLSVSSKVRIFDTKNYLALYQRTVYDDLSIYYYDIHSAAGLGRMFFNDKVELDMSVGYQDTKNFDSKINIIPSIRMNFKLTDRLTFNQRGYWFINSDSVDNDLRTSLIYRFSPRISLELRHTFERRFYEMQKASAITTANQVRNLFTFGLVFDL